MLPVRASLISAGILVALLATVIIGPLLRPSQASTWLGDMYRSVVLAVPVILVLTVVAHFVIPQP
jgi:hypothetical protein